MTFVNEVVSLKTSLPALRNELKSTDVKLDAPKKALTPTA